MKLEVITPERKLFKGEINSITVPGSKGTFMVLHNHAPIISTLEKGQIKIETQSNLTEIIEIEGGVIEVQRNNIIVLVDIN